MSTQPQPPVLAKVKSSVRIVITFLSAIYVFGGAAYLIRLAATCTYESNVCSQFEGVKDAYLLVLPVATGIITYWFAERSKSKKPDEQ